MSAFVKSGLARLIVIAAAGLLASCANLPPPQEDAEIDFAKVAQIEAAAKAYGTRIIWLHYPTKRAATSN
jgi:hypothetical protein